MTKFAKLSLVAAVAVAGVTSANAGSLEEAIKNVDISGTAVYRYDDRDSDSSNITNNSYKVAVNLSSKVNDDLKFNTRTIIGIDDVLGNSNDMAPITAQGPDVNAGFVLSQANFTYTGIANTTIIAGKQAVISPFAVQADAAGDESTGTGIVGLVNAGPVTLGGAYYNNTNLVTGEQDIAGVAVLANVGPVALDAWYLAVLETSNIGASGHDAISVGAKGKIEMVDLYARYSQVAHDANFDTEKLWYVGAKAKFGIVGLGVAYGQTNDVNNVTGNMTGVNLTQNGDADSKSSFQGWGLSLEARDDASLIKTNINVDVMSGLNVALNYNIRNNGAANDTKDTELYGQLTYKMSKNFMTYLRVGSVDAGLNPADGGNGGVDATRGRLHVQYSF